MPFRATHSISGHDHVLSDETPPAEIEALRQQGRLDLLCCPACAAPMRVRAGQVNVPHFAHQHRKDCPVGVETPELRAARLALYKWLKPKVESKGGTVVLEDWVPDAGLLRPIDLRVHHADGRRSVAFWLCDRPIRPERRSQIAAALKGIKARPCWVFTESMLEPLDAEGKIRLSTTEREWARHTRFDGQWNGALSLHYLTAGNTRLRSFRGLVCTHSTNVYRGVVRESDIDSVLMTWKGELEHHGEVPVLLQKVVPAWDPLPVSVARTDRADVQHNAPVLSPSEETEATPVEMPDGKICRSCRRHATLWSEHDPESDLVLCYDCAFPYSSSPGVSMPRVGRKRW